MHPTLTTAVEFIPAVPPPGGNPPRDRPTTQVMVTVPGWPGNTFRVWVPEQVGDLWTDTGRELQEFDRKDGGLTWSYSGNPRGFIEAEAIPGESSLDLVVRATNRSAVDLKDLGIACCLQMPEAPDFACDDDSRIYIRTGGEWSPLSSLGPASGYPHYFRTGLMEKARVSGWKAHLAHLIEPVESDHPLIVCVSTDGSRSIGTVSENYEYVFHNRANPHLLCIHSSPTPVALLRPGETASFRQRVYFVDGGLEECVAAFEADAAELGY